MRSPSFKSKIIWSYILLIIIPFIFLAVFLDRKLEDGALQDIKSALIKQAYLIENQIPAQTLNKAGNSALNGLARDFGAKTQARVTIIDKQGVVLADSEEPEPAVAAMENHAGRPEVRAALADNIGENIRYSATLKLNMLYIALPLKDQEKVVGVIRLALPLEQVRRILATTRNAIFSILLFALALAFLIGTIVSRSIIKPLSKIVQVSRKFARGEFNHRLYHGSGDEIGELAVTLNTMAEEIETKIREVEVRNQQLQAIFQSMVEGIIVLDKAAAIVTVNSSIERIFGVSREAVKGVLFLQAIPNNDIAEIVNQVLRKGELQVRELSIVWPVNRTFQINASPIFQRDEVTGCLLVMHDITEIRRLERVRSDFVANVSHELKTPLTSIKGFVETLADGALEDKENAGRFLQIIQEHTDRLNNLINDLLDLSYLESKAIRLETGKFDLKELVDKVFLGFKFKMEKRSLSAVDELPPGFTVSADRDKIEQVLTNLIDNAIKFNREKGSIKVYSQDMGDKIKIIVEDSGMGIPAKDITRIFERFYRVDKARSRELGGTGLGLSIVKHIVELHQGTLGVESAEGAGSKFWFILPK